MPVSSGSCVNGGILTTPAGLLSEKDERKSARWTLQPIELLRSPPAPKETTAISRGFLQWCRWWASNPQPNPHEDTALTRSAKPPRENAGDTMAGSYQAQWTEGSKHWPPRQRWPAWITSTPTFIEDAGTFQTTNRHSYWSSAISTYPGWQPLWMRRPQGRRGDKRIPALSRWPQISDEPGHHVENLRLEGFSLSGSLQSHRLQMTPWTMR